MARTPDAAHRAQLLTDIAEYMLANGYAGISLRPLAKAVGSSPRVLLYYFKSKENLAALALASARERQRLEFEKLQGRDFCSGSERCRAIWAAMSAPKARANFRLFFEVYGLALQDRRRFATFLRTAVHDWLRFIERPYLEAGASAADARTAATVLLAGFRGFMLDLCASGDRGRVNRAVNAWLSTLSVPPFGL